MLLFYDYAIIYTCIGSILRRIWHNFTADYTVLKSDGSNGAQSTVASIITPTYNHCLFPISENCAQNLVPLKPSTYIQFAVYILLWHKII